MRKKYQPKESWVTISIKKSHQVKYYYKRQREFLIMIKVLMDLKDKTIQLIK